MCVPASTGATVAEVRTRPLASQATSDAVEVVDATSDAMPGALALPVRADTDRATQELMTGGASPELRRLQELNERVADVAADYPEVMLTAVDLRVGKVEVSTRHYQAVLRRELGGLAHARSVYIRVDPSAPTVDTMVGVTGAPTLSAIPPGTRQSDYHPWSGGARYRLKGAHRN